MYAFALKTVVGATALYALGITSTANINTMRGEAFPECVPKCSSLAAPDAGIKTQLRFGEACYIAQKMGSAVQ